MTITAADLVAVAFVLGLVAAVAVVIALTLRMVKRRPLATPEQRATYEVLHTASLAAPPLRNGLTPTGAARALKHVRRLLGSDAVTLTDTAGILAWDGPGEAGHREQVAAAAIEAIASGDVAVLRSGELDCAAPDCPIRGGVVVPLVVGDATVGALVALTGTDPPPGLLRAATETGLWVATQLALAEAEGHREALAQAELRALRAQISPHFIYNALSAIASFVRTDPDRARDLLLEFAEFTRYSFRSHGQFTTLAEELRSIDRYLLLERARFGDRLEVRLQIAPEVLPVAVPFLCLQPLVENAVRHGLSGRPGPGRISIIATDAGAECHISIEDDGIGMDPALLAQHARADADESTSGQHVGMGNVDDRLRAVFGDDFGLVVETAPGAGTKISMRVPKFHPGVHAGSGVAS